MRSQDGQSKISSTCSPVMSDSQELRVECVLQYLVLLSHNVLLPAVRDVAATLTKWRHESDPHSHAVKKAQLPKARTKWVPVFPGTFVPSITATA